MLSFLTRRNEEWFHCNRHSSPLWSQLRPLSLLERVHSSPASNQAKRLLSRWINFEIFMITDNGSQPPCRCAQSQEISVRWYQVVVFVRRAATCKWPDDFYFVKHCCRLWLQHSSLMASKTLFRCLWRSDPISFAPRWPWVSFHKKKQKTIVRCGVVNRKIIGWQLSWVVQTWNLSSRRRQYTLKISCKGMPRQITVWSLNFIILFWCFHVLSFFLFF